MLDKLPNDILYTILLTINDINNVINISAINHELFNTLDDTFYTLLAQYIYTSEFWKRADKRSKILSKPLPNMKLELLRLDKFDNFQIKYGCEPWKNEDYYLYWDSMEKSLITQKNYSIGINNFGIIFNTKPRFVSIEKI